MKKYLNHGKSLTNILDNTTKQLFKKKGFHIFKLMAEWSNIAPEFADNSEPLNLKNQNDTKLLELGVKNEALIFELQYNKDHLINLINDYFGKAEIDDIKFKILHDQPAIQAKTEKKELKPSNLPVKLKKEIDIISDCAIQAKLKKIFDGLEND